MARKSRRWKQGLFPIDDRLIEKLIDDYAGGRDLDREEDDAPDIEPDNDEHLIWYLEESLADTTSEELDGDSASHDAVVWSDAYVVNMRVLNDYLQRRIADEPDPIAPTLH